MTGFTRFTCSPSRSAMRRSTPCGDGWWGPKLTVSSSPPKAPGCPVCVTVTPWPVASSIDKASGLLRRRQPRLVLFRELHRLAADGVVAAQRVSDPVVGHEDSRQLGMAVEDDSEHVVRLALVPVGGRKQVLHRVDLGRLAVDECAHAQVAQLLDVAQLVEQLETCRPFLRCIG